MACFGDINVSQGSVATYARCGGSFNIHLTPNLPRNLPVKNTFYRLRIDRIMVMSLWPRFFGPSCRQIQPFILGGVTFYFWSAVRLEGPKPEAQRTDRGCGFGEGKLAPSPSARGFRKRCKLPSGVRGGATAAKRFSYIPEAPEGLSRNLLRPSPPCPPP